MFCGFLLLGTCAQAQTPATPLERCLNLGENDLRSELRGVTRQFFDAELGAVDLPRMVENKWLELGLPELLEAEVGKAVDSVRGETVGWARLTSTLFPAQATELAEQVASFTFTSETFRSRLETLANEVSTGLTNTFASVATRSASSATQCVQTYLGNTYGNTVSLAFQNEIRAQLEATGTAALTGDIRPDGVVGTRSGVGVATIAGSYVARAVVQRLSVQLSRRIAGNITARILGRAGSSVIPVVGWIVGGGLIVWDVANGIVRGPFPAIERQLTSDATQAQIQQEIVSSLREDLPAVSAELSAGIASEIFTQWQSFTQNFDSVLNLAEEDAAFGQTVNTVPEVDLYKLAKVVQVVPEAEAMRAAQSGELRRVTELPESALEILETSASIPATLAWADLAGTQLDEVAANEVYRYKTPEDFSQQTLSRLLDTDNAGTIARVAALPGEAMDTLLQQLPTANLNALADEFGTAELQTVAQYADALAQEPFSALVVRLIERPSRLEKFAPEAVKNAVISSREPLVAVAFLGSEPTIGLLGWDFIEGLARDATSVLSGTVSSRLFLAKYDLGSLLLLLVIIGVALSIGRILLLLLSKIFQRRKRA